MPGVHTQVSPAFASFAAVLGVAQSAEVVAPAHPAKVPIPAAHARIEETSTQLASNHVNAQATHLMCRE